MEGQCAQSIPNSCRVFLSPRPPAPRSLLLASLLLSPLSPPFLSFTITQPICVDVDSLVLSPSRP